MRGYFERSSFGPNCLGFTKMEAITGEHSCFARATSARWPWCSAPMVATKPMTRLSARARRACSFIQAMVRIVSTVEGRDSRAGGGGALAIEMHEIGEDGLGALLPQHGGNLAAVIGSVVDDVLHGLPQRILVD